MGIAAAVATLAGGATLVRSLSSADSDGSSGDPAVRTADAAEEDEAAPTTEPGPTTIPPGEIRVTNGQVPGEAVVVGDEIRVYDADGQQTDAVSIAPLQTARYATTDLEGGWVVCGSDGTRSSVDDLGSVGPGVADASGAYLDQVIWFPASGEPVVLDQQMDCWGVRVVDSPQGPTLVQMSTPPPPIHQGKMTATVLATRETEELPLTGSLNWSVTSSHFLTVGPDGPQLHDATTGEPMTIADLDVNEFADVSLAPDASTIAVADGAVAGPVELSIYDTQTGEKLYSESFPLPSEGLELSYDGDTAAIGSFYDGNGPVTVIDIESGQHHTIDAYGLLL